MRRGLWARWVAVLSARVALVGSAAAAAGCGGDAFTAGPADAGPDASTSGAPAPPSDAPSEAAAGSFCTQHPGATFCEDFEGVATISDLRAKWSGFVTGNGSLSLVPGFASTHALSATAGNGDQASMVHAPFPGRPPTSVRVEYELRVDQEKVQTFDAAELTTLILGANPSTDPTVYLYLGSNSGLFLGWSDGADAGRGFHFQPLNSTPPLGSWAGRWGFTILMVDGTLTVTHDGVLVATSNEKLAMGDLQGNAVTLQAGLSHDTANTGTVTVAVDDLVVDIK